MTARRILLYLVILGAFLGPAIALGEESKKACVPHGDTVVCTRQGFDTLVRKFVTKQAEITSFEIKLSESEAHAKEIEENLQKCLATPIPPPEPPPAPPKPRSKLIPGLGVAAGILGGALTVSAVASDWSFGTRAGVGITGLALIGGGIFTVTLD
jgi:hypothetical protein